jgi:hypothetical protein
MANWADEEYFNFLPIDAEWCERRSVWKRKRLFEKEVSSLEKELKGLYEEEYVYELIDMKDLYEAEMKRIQTKLSMLLKKIHSLYFLYCNRLYENGELVNSVLNQRHTRMESIPANCLHYSAQLETELNGVRESSRVSFESK